MTGNSCNAKSSISFILMLTYVSVVEASLHKNSHQIWYIICKRFSPFNFNHTNKTIYLNKKKKTFTHVIYFSTQPSRPNNTAGLNEFLIYPFQNHHVHMYLSKRLFPLSIFFYNVRKKYIPQFFCKCESSLKKWGLQVWS